MKNGGKTKLVYFIILVSIVKSSHLYLYSAFNNTNCNKALHNIKIGKLCKMTGFNTQLSAECISLLNLVMALSSLVQFIISVQSSRWLCWKWSVPNWASQRRQRQGKKTPSVTEWRKKPWEKPGSVGGPVPLRPDESVVCSNCSKVRV